MASDLGGPGAPGLVVPHRELVPLMGAADRGESSGSEREVPQALRPRWRCPPVVALAVCGFFATCLWRPMRVAPLPKPRLWARLEVKVGETGEPLPAEVALWCQVGPEPAKLWPPTKTGQPVQVKVLTYNLFWWHLFRIKRGNRNSVGKLIAATDLPAYDFLGFQECEDIQWVLDTAGMLDDYWYSQGNHTLCMAFRKARWQLLVHGEDDVAEDQPNQYYGRRGVQWMRLRHAETGSLVFYVNHHGPLVVGSGGICGGDATAHNLVRVISSNAQPGDAIILAGDFNAPPSSRTVKMLEGYLHRAYTGVAFGGIDHVFTNLPGQAVLSGTNLGSGGSDHDALTVALQAGDWPTESRSDPLPIPPGPVRNPAHMAESGPGQPLPLDAPPLKGECLLEEGVNYVCNSGWGTHQDHVLTAKRCCELCKLHPECKAWIWVEDAMLPDGNPSQCWMKDSLPVQKEPKGGFVSGLLPA